MNSCARRSEGGQRTLAVRAVVLELSQRQPVATNELIVPPHNRRLCGLPGTTAFFYMIRRPFLRLPARMNTLQTPLLTLAVHEALLKARSAGGGTLECSLDLGLSRVYVVAPVASGWPLGERAQVIQLLDLPEVLGLST